MPCRLPSFRFALIVTLLGTSLLADAPAAAKSLEPQKNSLHSAVDSFVSYLKSETNEAMTAAVRIARENEDGFTAAKTRISTQIDVWRALLIGQKASPMTLGEHASEMWEAWREEAVSSWAKIEQGARDALDWIATWIRNQSLSDQHRGTPV